MIAETMNTSEAAAYLRLHPRTLERKARKGLVPAAKTGRKWLFRKADLDKWADLLAAQLATADAEAEDREWAELGLRSLAEEYGPEDEGLYDDPEAIGARRAVW